MDRSTPNSAGHLSMSDSTLNDPSSPLSLPISKPLFVFTNSKFAEGHGAQITDSYAEIVAQWIARNPCREVASERLSAWHVAWRSPVPLR
jgi:hypothetical protein